jgi:hypothetical protein
VAKLRRHLAGGDTIPDFPGAIEGDDRPICPGGEGAEEKSGTKGGWNPVCSHDASMAEAGDSSKVKLELS